MDNIWQSKSLSEVFQALRSSEHGLTAEEAARRLKESGLNKLPIGKVDSHLIIFLRQFQSPLIYILLAACVVVFMTGEVVDGSIILAVLFFNAVVGTVQEGKAQNTLLALKRFVETKATVIREEREFIILDDEIVVGDIIILQEGEKVPADARIIESVNLKIDEAALTGESEPTHKTIEALDGVGVSAADQKNMVFKGTHVVAGNGRAIVTATGIETMIGKISKEITAIDSEIPLKTNIRHLSRFIIVIVASISSVLFVLGIVSGESVQKMFAIVVSLAVSIIPEGLPIVMTLVLASGVWRMSKHNALVKNLQAVEALGQASVIAVDKTGTITKNEMVIQKVYLPASKAGADGNFFEIEGVGYESKGEVRLNGSVIDSVNHPELVQIGRIAAYCASAHVLFSEEEKSWRVSGDPTEAAMLVFAQKLGFYKDDVERESPMTGEIPFEYKLKYHATTHAFGGKNLLTVVGAPEVILDLSQKIWRSGKSHVLSSEERKKLETVFARLSEEGLRVVAAAEIHDMPGAVTPEEIKSLTFVGFFGMKDGLRPSVREAMEKARIAGIRVVMITGDHKITAQAIAREAGIYHDGDAVVTGQDIDSFSDHELSRQLEKTSIFARVTPEHKLRIIRAYKARGETIAMTGDGVNDAPSLVAADLGVSMGKIGTEVAKEASDIVLLDDNFESIVFAVEEGRNIYKTIKKVILYLFSTSWGEALTIIGALIFGFPLPLLPAQIIWLNFVTDGFLDVALAMEPKEEGLLKGSFEKSKKYLVNSLMIKRIFIMGFVMMAGTLFLFKEYYAIDLVKGWTVSLTVLAVFQWFNAWNCRHESKSIFQMNPFSNMYLVGATFVVAFLQFLVVYNAVMQKFLHTTALTMSEWLMIVLVAASIIVVEEVRKYFIRRKSVVK
ncbi:MAG: HAD-IC family P-type ATPase [Patescibacteria group bacterium]